MAKKKSKPRGPGRPKDRGLAERRHGEIVRQAIEEFARKGYAGADLDVIAAGSGCSKGTLYNYFSSKGDLFSASVDHVMFSLAEAVKVDDEGDAVEQIEQLVRKFLNHFVNHPQYVELLVQERSDFRDRAKPTYYQYVQTSRERWKKRFERLMDEGRMRRMPAERALNVLSDLMYGTIFMNYFRQRRIAPEQQAVEVLDILFGGILTAKGLQKRGKAGRI